MTQIVLIDHEQNPHGRKLVQEGNDVYVLSGCCGSRFDANHKITDTDGTTETWAKCLGCGTPLDRNEAGWSSDLENISQFVGYMPSGIGTWGMFWFGLEDFKMVVTR